MAWRSSIEPVAVNVLVVFYASTATSPHGIATERYLELGFGWGPLAICLMDEMRLIPPNT